ncbi:hypothetical protein DXG03_007576 [Asterophora parasitica]|uniref:Amidase domain-containing protein n=1 Tax=Asterophora parasitica TaxID=117018 RepID=A0A9P7KAR1_9AGAR|nr:hypothetical protein DXG03_007576 [Asterophora parasitica]
MLTPPRFLLLLLTFVRLLVLSGAYGTMTDLPGAARHELTDLCTARLYFPGSDQGFFSNVKASHNPSGKPQKVIIFPDLYEASVAELRAGLDAGHFSSVDLVKSYFARIEEVNLKGPGLRAVIEINPAALATAAELDLECRLKGPRSAIHGIPVLLKDNIATAASEGMNTTAGSFSLLGSVVPDDAGVVKRLRHAGAIILGKTNLSEFSHMRGDLPSGWSGRGGQTTNAYYPKGDPCGSSAGSGVAASIGLATVTLGTETDGSITCPAGVNNVVGIKPTLGLTSRAGVIPISTHQDSVGPITRSVADAATVLSIIAGLDPNDGYTSAQPRAVPNYTKALSTQALEGRRIGVPRRVFMNSTITDRPSEISEAFEGALAVLRSLGATIVDPADLPTADEILVSENEKIVLATDFKQEINDHFAHLKSNPSGVRNLGEVIQFNNDNPTLEKPKGYEDQSIFMTAEATVGFDSSYLAALAANHALGATRGIDAALKMYNVDALVLPSDGLSSTPAGSFFVTAPELLKQFNFSAIAGYPIVTVPLGFFSDNVAVDVGPETVKTAPGIPFGLSFFSTAYSEFELIGFAYAYEQQTKTRLARRAYEGAVPKTQLENVIQSL